MEPMLPDDGKHELSNRCVELVSLASGLAGRVHPTLRASIGDLVRSMNCYYSNLIEGHDTHPISIDRALAGDYSKDPEQRNLQLEARAHIEVQRMIDHGEAPEPVVSRAFLQWVHYEFCRRMPEELLIAGEDRDGKPVKVIPGEFRRQLVKVGRHIPIDADDVPAFLARFEQAYDPSRLSKVEAITAAAAAHHRLLWIHPFLDGNGRVARLFSHALLRHLGVGSELWSVSRGLARSKETYKQLLMAADADRRGDLDGRGHLTMAGLQEFCAYFLDQGIDQVKFMEGLMEPRELLRRMEIWTEEETRAKRLPKGSWQLLREAVVGGSFPRGRAAEITGYEERQARTVLGALLDLGVLVSPGPRTPVRLGFPATVLERWLPLLYPAMPSR
jgi:Fic family protein